VLNISTAFDFTNNNQITGTAYQEVHSLGGIHCLDHHHHHHIYLPSKKDNNIM